MNKTKKISLFSNALWNILTVVMTALAGFILVPVIINSIGTENYGIYVIILMIGGFASVQSLGLGEATLKYVSEYRAKHDIGGINRVIGATLSVYTVSGLIIFGAILYLAPSIINLFNITSTNKTDAVYALRIAGATFMVSIFSTALRSITEAAERYDILSIYNLLMMVIRYSAMYQIAVYGGGIIGLTYLTLISTVLDVCFYFVFSKKLIPGINCTPNFNKDGIKEIFSFGVFSFVNDIIQKLANYIDQFILGIFFSASSVAFLIAPKDLITKAQGLTGAAGQALFPRFSSMTENEEMEHLYVASLWVLTIFSIIVFVPMAILLPNFLSLWLSQDFAKHSTEFARIYCLGVAFNGGVTAYFALLKGTGRVRWLTNIILTFTIFSAVSTAYLVYSYGIVGSGIRMFAFSWIGGGLCVYIGKKIFVKLNLLKVILETNVIPLIISLSYYFLITDLLLNNLKLSWTELCLLYPVLLLALAFVLVVSNLVIFGRQGQANILIAKIVSIIGRRYEKAN